MTFSISEVSISAASSIYEVKHFTKSLKNLHMVLQPLRDVRRMFKLQLVRLIKVRLSLCKDCI